jgi:putative ABC transport system permease protein
MNFVVSELVRRPVRSATTLCGFTVATALALSITAAASGVQVAQDNALHPLARLGADILVTRSVEATKTFAPSAEDLQALQDEKDALEQANLVDVSKLGKPGDKFSHDFFLATTLLSFPAEEATSIRHFVGVAHVAEALTVDLYHREGIVPTIVAQFTVPSRTVTMPTPTAAEQVAVDRCMSNLPASQQTAAGLLGCLPIRLRQTEIQSQVLQQVINPPETDIRTTTLRVGGIDLSERNLGLLTPASIVSGAFFAGDNGKQAVISQYYAAREDLHVGSTIIVRGQNLNVVGIAQPPVGAITCDIYLPIARLQELSARSARVNLLLVRASSSSAVGQVAREIARSFPGARITEASTVADTITGSVIAAAVVAKRVEFLLIALVMAAAGINAWLLTSWSIRKRTWELGVLRAIGWKRADVVRQVVAEALILGSLGASAGIFVGTLAAISSTSLMPQLDVYDLTSSAHEVVRIKPELDASMMAAVLIGALLIAGFTAAFAGWQAARLRPAEAIRDLE